MVRIDRVYTRGGDGGETSLGSGTRVPKDSLRIEAYGTVDELNAAIGVVLAAGVVSDLVGPLTEIQQGLFDLGADLCVEEEAKKPTSLRVGGDGVKWLEELVDRLTGSLEPLDSFVLPAGTPAAAALHVARTVCRRAERRVVALARVEPLGAHAVAYLNRLSDALFVMARYENLRKGAGDVLWNPRR
ncbi:MAG: cob(I)yrinic acid a,c-diamide adenosyltransferase [Planctomycetota bacterium]